MDKSIKNDLAALGHYLITTLQFLLTLSILWTFLKYFLESTLFHGLFTIEGLKTIITLALLIHNATLLHYAKYYLEENITI